MNGCLLTILSATAPAWAVVQPADDIPTAAPVVTAVPLEGESASGPLLAIDGGSVAVEVDGERRAFPLKSLRELSFDVAPPDAAGPPADTIAVGLTDGSEFPATAFAVADRRATLTAAAGFSASLPVAAVRAVRFRPAPPAAREAWRELADSNPARDAVVVAKGDSLDRIEAAVGTVTAESVTVELRGRTVPLPRANANFVGVVYARPRPPEDDVDPIALRLVGGGDLRATSVTTADDGTLAVSLPSGPTLSVPLAGVSAIDYSGGKIRYLSEIPTRAESTEDLYRFEGSGPIDPNWEIWRDRNPHGDPIRLGRRDFDRGLCVHSKSTLRWRLAGAFRRLRGVVGIESIRVPRGVSELVVRGDGNELFRRPVVGTDPPFDVDIDVTGVRDLELEIGFGADADHLFPGSGDWVGLGDLRVTK